MGPIIGHLQGSIDACYQHCESDWKEASFSIKAGEADALLRRLEKLEIALGYLKQAEGTLRTEGYDTRDIMDILAALEKK